MANTLDISALKKAAAEVEARRAAEEQRFRDAEEAKRKALLDELSTRIEPTPEAIQRGLDRVGAMVNAAAERGRTETMVFRFPNALTTDKGRAINNAEGDWPRTLTGRPAQVYGFWKEHLEPKGFRLKAMVVEYPGGMPGDIGFFLAWGDE
ncbi:MAG: hypothetical protein MUC89_20335 [Acetobacteraceae bacterium]|jgi:hypothetical protein|nr:hypothetical protein [Acetobacteraceae bacterium]